MDVEAISTGALSLDVALGIGGLPRGRVVEIYGPESSGKSTLAMHVVAEAQRNGGICAYIDAEHAMDPIYARAIGVNVDELLISQPDTGEQALEITDMLIRSGAIDVFVIDSVAALTPRAEIEGEMGDTHVGLQARLMSQALRKLTGNAQQDRTPSASSSTSCGKRSASCSAAFPTARASRWPTAPRRRSARSSTRSCRSRCSPTTPISTRSYRRRSSTGSTTAAPSSSSSSPLHAGAGNGRAQFALHTEPSDPHTGGLARGAGARSGRPGPAGRIPQALRFQWQVILGGLMGDGALSPSPSGHGARYRWGHGPEQTAYGDWKASLLANIGVSRRVNADGVVHCDVSPLPELADTAAAVYAHGKKVFSYDYLKHLTPLSVAIWYMDDGGFTLRAKGMQERTRDGSGRSEICVEAMELTTRERLVNHLADTWDIRPKLFSRGEMAVLSFPKDETAKLHALIAPFVHPSMDYKLLPRFRGRFAVEPVFAGERRELVPMPITAIKSKPSTRSMHRFDIEVEGSHNYFADGVMVHNSPETTPGGRALKFYSSVRLDIRRIESIKDGVEVVGNRTRVKVVKNKVSSPFKQAEFDIMYGKGISREGSLIDIGVDLGIVKKSGAWYTYDGEQLGQGRRTRRCSSPRTPS